MKFDGVSESLTAYTVLGDYEHEHRFTEHEHEEMQEQSDADEGLDRPFLTCVESTTRPRSSLSFVHQVKVQIPLR